MGITSTEPTWIVQVVSDDAHCNECCGADEAVPATHHDASPGAFAYTIGLHDRGAPELQLWARPTDGQDPGADWEFSARDLAQVLNDLAAEVLAGRLSAGGCRTEVFDGGDATVTFRLGAPVAREEVDAFGVDPAAAVLPVRWSLRRPPEGPRGPADHAALEQVRTLLRDLRPRPSDVRDLPPTWRCDDLEFDPDGVHGPLTPLVRGLAAAVVGGDGDQLVRFLVECASGYSTGTSAGYVLAQVRAAARPVGRSAAIDRLVDTVPHLAAVRVEDAGWPRVVDDVTSALGCSWPTASDDLATMLRQGLLALLGTAVVHDVAGRELLLEGTGPFRWSRSATVGSPAEFLASDRTVRAVAVALAHLRPGVLPTLLDRHERALAHDAYLRAVAHLQGTAVTTAMAIESLGAVLPRAVARRARRDGLVAPAWSWASVLVGAVCATSADPRRLSVELAEAFCAPYDDLLPELRGLLRLGPHYRP
ncbi:hypothetical protein [uncultured Nocardioides sp.]|uniref:hypothetical protein n=1 Tax=uncultured Nocardioides sp. TaxID=198441 RepID=UPI00262B7F95|nr:hypothetical protein [uncultured Nocardioides sp.]